MSTICGKESIQHDLTNSLDPSLRLNRYHGDPGKNELIVYYMAINEKTKDRQHPQPHRIGCTASCQEDNTPSHQKRENRQSDDPVIKLSNIRRIQY